MNLPFTTEQFFGVFADYNQMFWWAATALWLAAGIAMTAAIGDRARKSRQLNWMLAVLWLWNGIAYHAAFFSRINPAAWLFAGLFIMQAILFALAASAHHEPLFFSMGGWRQRAGLAIALYGLTYPMINIVAGHEYPATPTFGVPCPTAIFSIGLLMTMRAQAAKWLLMIPIAWAFIGGSAALLFNVWPDYVLLIAGVAAAVDLAGRFVPRHAAAH